VGVTTLTETLKHVRPIADALRIPIRQMLKPAKSISSPVTPATNGALARELAP
jgi:hypothetical protein